MFQRKLPNYHLQRLLNLSSELHRNAQEVRSVGELRKEMAVVCITELGELSTLEDQTEAFMLHTRRSILQQHALNHSMLLAAPRVLCHSRITPTVSSKGETAEG